MENATKNFSSVTVNEDKHQWQYSLQETSNIYAPDIYHVRIKTNTGMVNLQVWKFELF